jgi:hypothetical protein
MQALTWAGLMILVGSLVYTGFYSGTPDDGSDGFQPPAPVSCPFQVCVLRRAPSYDREI